MQKRKGFSASSVVLIIAVLALIAGIGYYASRSSPQEEKTLSGKTGEEATGGEHMMDEGEMMKDEAMAEKDTMMEKKVAPLLNFTKADYDAAVKTDKLIVLYFYANWCPICVLEFPKMKTAFNEVTSDKVIGFRVNYNDSDTDADEKNLAREFGVAYQHTKVFLKNGTRILKSPESWDKARYLTEINKAL